MPSEQSFWYRLGYALERAKQIPASGGRKLAGLDERAKPDSSSSGNTPREGNGSGAFSATDDLVASGAVALAVRLLDRWQPRRKLGFTGLLKAGASGAAAALLVELVRPLLKGRADLPELGGATAAHMLVGAGQGLVYGGLVEPRLPGPETLKGALYGSAEYAVAPSGGLATLLGPLAPHRRIPVLGHLLADADTDEQAFLEHVAFGVALGVLYGSVASSNGIREDVGGE